MQAMHMCFEDFGYLFTSSSASRGIARLNINEATCLFRYAKLAGGDIVEIGRWDAGSTCLIAGAIRDNVIFSIDILERPSVQDNLLSLPFSVRRRVHIITGDSSTIGKTWKHHVHMVFVDGDHSIDGVRKDVDAWGPHVPVGGHMLFHDVREYGEERIDEEIRKFNLKKLLKEMTDSRIWEQVDYADSLVVLRKRKERKHGTETETTDH